MNYFKQLFICLGLLLLAGCAVNSSQVQDGAPDFYVDVSKIPDAVPKVEPLDAAANPPSYVVDGQRYYVLRTSEGYHVRGIASWYGTKFNDHVTSTGEPYDMLAMTAASKVLPIPCYVRVTNLENGKQVIVRVNDRGPFEPNRILDLSYVAARKLDMIGKGTAYVEVDAIDPVQYQWQLHHPYYQQQASSYVSHSYPAVIPPHAVWLQVGVYSQLSQAEARAKAMADLTYTECHVFAVHINGKLLYRVRLGPISREAATRIAGLLHREGHDSFIVPVQ